MANKTWDGSGWLAHVGTTAASNATVASITAAGLITATMTAPNLVDPIKAVWIHISTLPTNGGNIVVTLQENGVDTTCTTYAAAARLRKGWNLFFIPNAKWYTPTSLTAGYYRWKVANSVGTSGQVRVSTGTAPAYSAVYGSAGSLGSTDNPCIGGAVTDDVLTSLTYTNVGTTLVFGDGADTALASTSNLSTTFGQALLIGNGGKFERDPAASSTFQMRGTALVYEGGTLDISSDTDKNIVSTVIIDNNSAAGQFGILTPPNAAGTINAEAAEYVRKDIVLSGSGSGTAANPLILQNGMDAQVNDELIFGTTGSYTQQERRFVKTRNSDKSFVLSSTIGGAESALSNNHTGAHVINVSSNVIVKAQTTSRGFWLYHQTDTTSNYKGVRWENASNLSSKGLIFTAIPQSIDQMVLYGAGGNSRNLLSLQSISAVTTVSGIVAYATDCNNIANGAIGMQTSSNITLVGCVGMGDGTAGGGCHFAFSTNCSNITMRDCWSYGANGLNTATSAAVYVSSSNNVKWLSGGVNGSRLYGVALNNAFDFYAKDSNMGGMSANGTSDMFVVSSTFNTGLAENCLLSSTPITNYLNQIDGSEFRFHKLNQIAHNHAWYDVGGYAEATGAGLSDTTVRTAGGYNVKMNPQNATRGFQWIRKVKAVTNQIPFLKSYVRKNTTLTSAPVTVGLYLPGTELTDTPDDLFTAANTPNVYQDFVIGTLYSGSENTEAQIKYTILSSSGVLYAADDYDSLESLNSWYRGKPSELIVPTDFSSIPGLIANYPDTSTSANTMGRRWVDTGNNAEETRSKVNLL